MRRVAGVLGELGRGGLQDVTQKARLELHQKPVHLGPGAAPMVQRHRIVAELDAGLGQNAVGRRLDPAQVFFAQNVIGRDVAGDIGPAQTATLAAAFRRSCLPPAAPLLAHCWPPRHSRHFCQVWRKPARLLSFSRQGDVANGPCNCTFANTLGGCGGQTAPRRCVR